MKAVRAKLLANPISTQLDFAPGGNMVPIQTLSSGQSDRGVQQTGLNDGKSKTILGPYRMGDDDGNAQAGAIYYNDVNPPVRPSDRKYPTITFQAVGNNAYQPETDKATPALLKRLGDTKFKAEQNEPFANWFSTQRLAREADQSARNAGLEDLGKTREIMRNLVATRRQQNEDDYMRRMMDSGVSMDDAKKEIEDVRKARNLLEAKKVDDRSYQAKLLISRIAALRGVASQVNEPLTQSGAIENPQPSEAVATMMGNPGQGFGSSPLDTNRQFLTPDFYRKFLRKSKLTQESADEQAAVNNFISEATPEARQMFTTSGFSAATVDAKTREDALLSKREALASRLESIRNRGKRITGRLPELLIAPKILQPIYDLYNRKPGDKTYKTAEVIQEMNINQVLLAINQLVATKKNALPRLSTELKNVNFGSEDKIASDTLEKLRNAVLAINVDSIIDIPFASTTTVVNKRELWNAINDIKRPSKGLIDKAKKERLTFVAEGEGEPIKAGEAVSLDEQVPAPPPLPTVEKPAPPPGFSPLPKPKNKMTAADWKLWSQQNDVEQESNAKMIKKYGYLY